MPVKVLHLPNPESVKGYDLTDFLKTFPDQETAQERLSIMIDGAADVELSGAGTDGALPETADRPLAFVNPADLKSFLSTAPPKTRFFITDRVPRGRGILITGVGGSSKTRVLYLFAIAGVIGRLPWGWEVETVGKAVLVLTEDTMEDVHKTLFPLIQSMNLTAVELTAIEQNLIIFPMAGVDLKLLKKTANGTLEKSQQYYELAEAIQALGDVVFVGIDPVLSITEGDELDQGHQRAAGKMADDMAIQTGATVALVAHATKGSLQGKELQSHNSRGGGAITDAVRAEYSMRNMTADEAVTAGIDDLEERKRYVQLAATKGNALPPSAFVPVWLRRDDFGNLSEAEITFTKKRISDKEMDIFNVLVEMSAKSSVTTGEWRKRCEDMNLIAGPNQKANEQTMTRLCQKFNRAGMIKRGVGKGVWIPTHDNGI